VGSYLPAPLEKGDPVFQNPPLLKGGGVKHDADRRYKENYGSSGKDNYQSCGRLNVSYQFLIHKNPHVLLRDGEVDPVIPDLTPFRHRPDDVVSKLNV